MKMNSETLETKPNAGARKISNSGTVQPITINKVCLLMIVDFNCYLFKKVINSIVFYGYVLLMALQGIGL